MGLQWPGWLLINWSQVRALAGAPLSHKNISLSVNTLGRSCCFCVKHCLPPCVACVYCLCVNIEQTQERGKIKAASLVASPDACSGFISETEVPAGRCGRATTTPTRANGVRRQTQESMSGAQHKAIIQSEHPVRVAQREADTLRRPVRLYKIMDTGEYITISDGSMGVQLPPSAYFVRQFNPGGVS